MSDSGIPVEVLERRNKNKEAQEGCRLRKACIKQREDVQAGIAHKVFRYVHKNKDKFPPEIIALVNEHDKLTEQIITIRSSVRKRRGGNKNLRRDSVSSDKEVISPQPPSLCASASAGKASSSQKSHPGIVFEYDGTSEDDL